MQTARFVSGSTRRHIIIMTSTQTLSLLAIFLVDFIDMLFLSMLGEVELAAAIGYSGTILFFTTSICIGLSIASGALVARALGANEPVRAKRFIINSYVASLVCTIPIALAIWLATPALLNMLGATGRAHELASLYLRIIIPSMPLLALAMASNGVLRGVGDARRSLYAMLAGSAVNAILDPILIFGLGLGIAGAALASIAARLTIMLVSLYYVCRVHRLLDRFQPSLFWPDLRPFFSIALPAILTNIATPVGNAYVIASMATFGDSAVAGSSIISRLAPVAFCAVFALSGSVGPIIGQNFGAKRIDRVRQTLWDSLQLVTLYVLIIWLLLAVSRHHIIALFGVSDDAAALILLFCLWLTPSFIFNGASFASNAAFNNLGVAHYATLLNFGKATIGTIPFVYFGSLWYGAAGVMIGQALGAILFGILGSVVVFAHIARLEHQTAAPPQATPPTP